MKEIRSSLLLLVSLLLFLMSFIILCTWGYNAYYRNKDKAKGEVMMRKDTAAIAKATRDIARATRDSLRTIYALTIRDMDRRFDSTLAYADSLRVPINLKLAEFYKLKKEISDILKEKNNDADLEMARGKITELQKKVEDLVGKNYEVEQENKKLYAIISQLSKEKTAEQTSRPVVYDNKTIPEKPGSTGNIFQAYEIRLTAMMVNDDKEAETFQALQADKFVGSLIVKNNNAVNNVAELFIIINRPDGKVMQKSSWESGTFETMEGRKIYSLKLRFDYIKGEPKKLLFTLPGEQFIKGTYQMQVYHNGIVIGKISKTLN